MTTLQYSQLIKPTILQILCGALFRFLKNNEKTHLVIPQQIGDYTLISKMPKKEFFKFALGIYTDGKEKFFIKTWTGKAKNLNYYSLVNEVRVGVILNTKLAQSEFQNRIHVPKIV